MKDLTEYAKMRPAPELAQKIVEDLKSPLCYAPFPAPEPEDAVSLQEGVTVRFEFPDPEKLLETALDSLHRVLASKKIPDGTYPVYIQKDVSFSKEEFLLKIGKTETVLKAADTEGIRRGIFLLEDQLLSFQGKQTQTGEWCRKPYIFHRISRCFFGPTNRPPYFIDELMNDVNYYPEEYLNKLAHEGINGLWLTMYFNDFPSSIFSGRGKDAPQRFRKLRETVRRCARFGIRIYVFVCEPKCFADTHFNTPIRDSDAHPEMTGPVIDDPFFTPEYRHCCTSSPETLRFLAESTGTLFREVPGLGGIINLIFGEDNGSCIDEVIVNEGLPTKCPRCSKRIPGEIYRDVARAMYDAMHREAPQAEFIGWFYAPRQRDGSVQGKMLSEIAPFWPDETVFMLNMESGVVEVQSGKGRTVFDYSLACTKPSELFKDCARKTAKKGAKIQVGCSHEDASVPFIPVPLNLYRKYRTLHELGVSTVMQCWYFGNYPGLMNRAAGRLSFEPFPQTEEEFLLELARPQWGIHAPQAAAAWQYFTEGYTQFPMNIAFEWYGPLHNSIVWPLHLKPVDQGIAPSWIMEGFPEISGDRIGECLQYQHTFAEALELCDRMSEKWQKGTRILHDIRKDFAENPDRLADINLADAIGLQMKSTANLLHFYDLREEMFRTGENRLPELEKIVRNEIANTKQMLELCQHDPRLGYHSEAECHLFYPQKLSARIALLESLLAEDFANFDINAPWIKEWTGEKPTGPCIRMSEKGAERHFEKVEGTAIKFAVEYSPENLTVLISGIEGKRVIIELEPCRLWPPMRADFDDKGNFTFYDWIFREIPGIRLRHEGNLLCFDLPWKLFEGYRHEGFPMRFNVSTSEHSFVPGKQWPSRLLQREYNPSRMAWLIK